MSSPARRRGLLVAAILSAGCGSTLPQTPAVHHAREARERVGVDSGPSSTESEIGGLSQYDVERELEALEPRLVDCVHRAAAQMSYLGGRVSLRMRLDRAGKVRWVYLKETTLGDRDAERCVLELVRSRTWPRPLSGEGLAETSFDVDPAEPPPDLPSHKATLLARRASAATKRCRAGVRGEFKATAYFDPRGEVLSVGVAPPDETGEPAADCVADALRELRLEHRGGRADPASKLSFRIAP